MAAFSRRHPLTCILYFLAVILLSMVNQHPLFLAVSLAGSLCCSVYIKGTKALKMFFFALLPLLAFVTVINSFFASYGETQALTVFGRTLMLEPLVFGASTGCTVVTMILWFMCWNEIITSDKFMQLFSRRFPDSTLLLSSVLRFIPLYSKQFTQTVNARKALGINESKAKTAFNALSGVITAGLESSIDTADSMKSRGYGVKGRTSYKKIRFSAEDLIIISVCFAFAIVSLYAKIIKCARASYNPQITVSGFSPAVSISLIAYAFLCLFPIIYGAFDCVRFSIRRGRIK